MEPVAYFLAEMNKNCCLLNLRSSFFDNPHGLMNVNSRSTAFDISKLSAECMKSKQFVDVVSTKFYVVPKSEDCERAYKWENTNKLLEYPGVNGVKTGITNTAGPCLATSITLDQCEMIVVLLSSKNMDIRFTETIKLAKWANKRLKRIKQF